MPLSFLPSFLPFLPSFLLMFFLAFELRTQGILTLFSRAGRVGDSVAWLKTSAAAAGARTVARAPVIVDAAWRHLSGYTPVPASKEPLCIDGRRSEDFNWVTLLKPPEWTSLWGTARKPLSAS